MKSLLTAILLTSFSALAQDKVGGGGDDWESRVSGIRQDILRWIEDGGPKGLRFQDGMDAEEYTRVMTKVLQKQAVTVIFVRSDDLNDEELQVSVDGKPKTCRGFISRKDGRPNILCNTFRFRDTPESGQYRLIHHEYAGLAGVEKNEGAVSDYYLSEQLTDYLRPTLVLKLGLKKSRVDQGNGMVIYNDPNLELIPFKASWKKDQNLNEAHKICMLIHNRSSRATDFIVRRISQEYLAKAFPAILVMARPTFGDSYQMIHLLSSILVDGWTFRAPTNGESSTLQPTVEQSNYRSQKLVLYFSSVTCEKF